MQPPCCPLPAPLPAHMTRRLASLLRQDESSLRRSPWSWLDGSRIRLESSLAGRRWNLIYADLKEGNLLLAMHRHATLRLQLEGEVRGPAALNVGDALLEGLERGCDAFVLDLAKAQYLGPDAVHLVAKLRQQHTPQGQRVRVRLLHADEFPELRQARRACS